jgi:cytoskeletal protein CcmA (bactofilin family)
MIKNFIMRRLLAIGRNFESTSNGLVIADNIQVRGEIQQTIEARMTLAIKSTGRVKGQIAYQSLEIESGGTIDGKVDKYAAKKDNASAEVNDKPSSSQK